MKLDVTKFGTCSLSTLTFITEKKRKKIVRNKIGCQRQPEAIKSKKSATVIVTYYKKNIFPSSYHGARTLTAYRFFFLALCWTAPRNISKGSTACFTTKRSTVDAPLFAFSRQDCFLYPRQHLSNHRREKDLTIT